LDYLGQYLGMTPGDPDALARYGAMLDDHAKSRAHYERAFFTLDRVLNRDAARDDVRRRVIRLALRLGNYKDAHHHLNYLLTKSRDDAELLHLQARSFAGELKFNEALASYDRSLLQDPKQIEASLELAELLRRQERPREADRAIERLL